MEGMVFDRINSLEKSRSDWRIKVRVTRMWPTVSPETGTTKGFNLILLDDDNSHIHGFSFADVWNLIGKDVAEGNVYVIETFSVRDAAGNLKPVSNESIIRFSSSTTFIPCADDAMIPAHKFEFLDLGDIFAEASLLGQNENPEFAIDVIGVVENFERVTRIPTKFGERDIVRFRICDTSNRHRVGVWGDLARVVSDEYYKHDPEERKIVIITSIKMGTYKSSVQLSTLPSSKVFFNLEHDYVHEMMQRLEEEGYKPKESDTESNSALAIVSPYENTKLEFLNEKAANLINAKIFCKFTIAKLDEDKVWFVYSCSKCQLEVVEVGNRFKCNNCNRNLPVAEKRFSVKAVVEDSTYSCTLIMLDRIVMRLTGSTASKLYRDQTKEEQCAKLFPDVLKAVVGQDITAIIEINQASDSDGRIVISATDIYDNVVPANTGTESSSNQHFPSIDLTESFDDAESSKTPGSAKSVNKKIKMEK